MNRRASADTIRINDQRFWYTYLLVLSNGKYYTGYTKDIKERFSGITQEWYLTHLPIARCD
jgi:hypothetical protein